MSKILSIPFHILTYANYDKLDKNLTKSKELYYTIINKSLLNNFYQGENSMKTVFIPPICNWSFLRQLPQQMASQFAKHGYRVIYCNERPVQGGEIVNEVEPNLFVYRDASSALGYIKNNDVKIEFSPEQLGQGPAKHMICYDPSGIRVEFIWPGN